jgi:hypothetical protein
MPARATQAGTRPRRHRTTAATACVSAAQLQRRRDTGMHGRRASMSRQEEPKIVSGAQQVPEFMRTSHRIQLTSRPAALLAVLIPDCAVGLSVAVDNAGALLSFFLPCTLHQINGSTRSGRAISTQMSAAPIASDPIAIAPSITFTVVTLGKTIWTGRT